MIYIDLFLTFFKIGAFTFGGGYAMIPLIQSEIVAKGWLSTSELIDFIAVSESTPGPFAVNISTYVGMETGGILGALCATTGVVLPSFMIILLIAKGYEAFKKSQVVEGAMLGLRPTVVGLIATSVLSIGRDIFLKGGETLQEIASPVLWIQAGILVGILILLHRKWHPIVLILLSGGVGIVLGVTGLLPI